MPDEAEVYTDGSCAHNGDGGWAWILVHDGNPITFDRGAERDTTNQRMELVACLRALESVADNLESLTVVSDSSYLVNCFRRRWFEAWESNGWRTAQKNEVKNRDLWELLLVELRKRKPGSVRFRHVKGHNGNRWNELADQFAGEARVRLLSN